MTWLEVEDHLQTKLILAQTGSKSKPKDMLKPLNYICDTVEDVCLPSLVISLFWEAGGSHIRGSRSKLPWNQANGFGNGSALTRPVRLPRDGKEYSSFHNMNDSRCGNPSWMEMAEFLILISILTSVVSLQFFALWTRATHYLAYFHRAFLSNCSFVLGLLDLLFGCTYILSDLAACGRCTKLQNGHWWVIRTLVNETRSGKIVMFPNVFHAHFPAPIYIIPFW